MMGGFSLSDFESINRIVKEYSKSKTNRNFNYYVSSNQYDNISITYELSDNKYWGLSPIFSEKNIIEWIVLERSPLESAESLKKAYRSFSSDGIWKMDGVDERVSMLYFMRSMLSFSQHFYFYYETNEVADRILARLWNYTTDSNEFDYIDINNDLLELNTYDSVNRKRKINGRIPIVILQELNEQDIRYSFVESTEGKPYIKLGPNEKKPIINLYEDSNIEKYMFCVSPTFYSGLMARVEKIEGTELSGNAHIFNYNFHLSAITYATHLGFKDPRMSYEKLFFNDEEKALLLDADKNECYLQEKLYNGLKKEDIDDLEMIDLINEYLYSSHYTHGMNISGNVITKDNQLIYTKRGKETWDSSVLYCSVNGVAEINDEDVYFYNHSVQCDRPQIGEYNTAHGNFSGELSRETYAELGIDIKVINWDYYGFCVMGYHNNKNQRHSFPLHFNILASAATNKTVEEISETSNSAVEKEENENVKSLLLVFKRSIVKKVFNVCKVLFKGILGISPDLLILLVLYNNIMTKKNHSIINVINDMEFIDVVSLVIALLVVVHLTIKTIASIKGLIAYKKRRTLFICLYKKDFRRIVSAMDRKYSNASSLFILMFLLYYKDAYTKAYKR